MISYKKLIEALKQEWLRIGEAFVKHLGEDQTKWHWKLFMEKGPAAVMLLEMLREKKLYPTFMLRQRSFNLGLRSKIFDPLPIRIQLHD